MVQLGTLEEKRIIGNRPFDCRCRFVSQHDCDWWGEPWLEHPARVCFDDGIVGKVVSGRLRLNSAVHTGELHEMAVC